MSCPTDTDSGITRCEDAVGNLLPDNFFLEGYLFVAAPHW